jgi:hypothetical protein
MKRSFKKLVVLVGTLLCLTHVLDCFVMQLRCSNVIKRVKVKRHQLFRLWCWLAVKSHLHLRRESMLVYQATDHRMQGTSPCYFELFLPILIDEFDSVNFFLLRNSVVCVFHLRLRIRTSDDSANHVSQYCAQKVITLCRNCLSVFPGEFWPS